MKTAAWREQISEGVTWIAPEPAPEGASVWFFTRRGGVSKPPFDTLNISTAMGDDDSAVSENLARIKKVMDGRESAWVRQVAGADVVRVGEPGLAGEADAMVTSVSGVALMVAAADCVPVALVGESEVGMAHSGWRGTLAGVTGNTVKAMAGDSPIKAYIGPCIRQCCYEVSEELAEKFSSRFGPEVVYGRQLSLPAAIRKNLEEVGVGEVNDLGLCTGCRPDLFFSHRKQGPKTGRMAAVVARR